VSLLEVYKLFLQKEKVLYSTLNKFKKEDKLFLGFCWIPRQDNEEILKQVEGLKDKDRNIEIPTLKVVQDHSVKPPSLFRLNEVTWVFQEIVNTYGIPTYKEVNPSVFAIVTFPFLFGIMFGDIGHGFVLFLVGGVLCLLSDFLKARAPGMEPLLGMRYLFLLMGLFATFAGLIYNDFMAIPLWLWDSCYDLQEIHMEEHHEPMHHGIPIIATLKKDCVYPIGLDPVWHLGSNELAFMNSLKMKLSVILGVLQMGLGVCMKALNAYHFKNKMDFFCEFVPQIILLFVLFGYMDMMIIAKWLTDFSGRESFAPSIISNMIDMALNGGAIAPGTSAIIGSAGTQQAVSILFLLIALICVPTMLFPKPFYIDKMNKLHEHQAHHDDHHNKESIPLQEKVHGDSEKQ
jgi:V-type H+-transporting ATPase subunit a